MEYWITDTDIIFCDGDSGVDVPNHAMVVVHHCAEILMDALIQEGSQLASAVAATMAKVIADDSVIDCVALRCAINDEMDSWCENGLCASDCDIFDIIADLTGLGRVIVSTAMGHHDDPRELGLDWGWVRVIQNEFCVAKLTRAVADKILDFAMEHPQDTWSLEVRDFGGRRVYLMGLTTAELGFRSLRSMASRRSVMA